MPQLETFRKTEKIKLPSFPDSELEIYTSLLYGETLEVDINKNDQEQLLQIVCKIIKSWNFTDKDKKECVEKNDAIQEAFETAKMQMRKAAWYLEEQEGQKKEEFTKEGVIANQEKAL